MAADLENEPRRTGDPPFPSVATPEFRLEIPTVSEEVYRIAREAVEVTGHRFIVAIKPVSIGQLSTDRETEHLFGYVDTSETMRAITPLQMEVAINPYHARIEDSNMLSTDAQLRMIQEREAALKGKLPEEVRAVISMRMPNASVLAQLDFEYQRRTGELLLPDYFARTDDQTIPLFVAIVGRDHPTSRLNVHRRGRSGRGDHVFAVSMVVLPRKQVVDPPTGGLDF